MSRERVWACRTVRPMCGDTGRQRWSAPSAAEALRMHIGVDTREVSARMGVPTVKRFRICRIDPTKDLARAERLHFVVTEVAEVGGSGACETWAWQPIFLEELEAER